MKFEQWSTFHEEMVGKRVIDKASGDEGVITSRREHSAYTPCTLEEVYVLWDDGKELWSELSEIRLKSAEDFENSIVNFESITINGKRYKLVPIEEE